MGRCLLTSPNGVYRYEHYYFGICSNTVTLGDSPEPKTLCAGAGAGGLLEEPVEQKKKRWMRAPGNVYLYTFRQKT